MQTDPIVGLVMATMLEAKPFVAGIPLKKVCDQPFPVFRNERILLILSGIGKANAAMAAFHCCRAFSPGIMVNAGAAGAAGASIPLGQWYLITRIVEYDRPNLASGKPETHFPRILDGFPTATLATQDKPVVFPEKRSQISKMADLVDMEAASVVQACNLQDTPCVVLKYVTDTPEHTQSREIVRHIRAFRQPFYDAFMKKVLPEL